MANGTLREYRSIILHATVKIGYTKDNRSPVCYPSFFGGSFVSKELLDWAWMLDIEFVHIAKVTLPEMPEEKFLIKDLEWKLK